MSETTEVEIEEVDFVKENDTVLWYNDTPTRGVLRAKDYAQLPLQGIYESYNNKLINITFEACQPSHEHQCSSEEEIENFLDNH